MFIRMKTVAVLFSAALCAGVIAAPPAASQEEFLIVKYGSVQVRSAEPAKVFIDDVYKGMSNTVIESIMAGDRTISCTLGEETVSGTFTVKKNELLRLEARFNEGKLLNATAIEEEAARKKKELEAAAAAAKQEQKRKAESEAKRPERPEKAERSPADERRDLHLNIFKIEFRDREAQEAGVTARHNPKVISGYAESRNQSGRYYRTKQNLLLCEAGQCVQEWTAKFSYTDETGKKDNFMVTWKQTVFTGITQNGTRGREITWCVNGACKKALDTDTNETPLMLYVDNYVLTWTKASAIFRRVDIMKEVLDAGGTLPE